MQIVSYLNLPEMTERAKLEAFVLSFVGFWVPAGEACAGL